MTKGIKISTPDGEHVVTVEYGSPEWRKAIEVEIEEFVLDVLKVMQLKEAKK